MRRADGSYPFDAVNCEWERIIELSESIAKMLAGGEVMNKEFVVIPSEECDWEYSRWDEDGREAKSLTRRYFRHAVAVYRHDFKWWLIRHI